MSIDKDVLSKTIAKVNGKKALHIKLGDDLALLVSCVIEAYEAAKQPVSVSLEKCGVALVNQCEIVPFGHYFETQNIGMVAKAVLESAKSQGVQIHVRD